jgi:hypothetical protein
MTLALDAEKFRKEMREAGIRPETVDPQAAAASSTNGHSPPEEARVTLEGDLVKETLPRKRLPRPLEACVGRRSDNDTLILPKGAVDTQDSAARLFGLLAQTEKFFQKGGVVVAQFDPDELYQPKKRTHKKYATVVEGKGALRRLGPGEFRSAIEQYVSTFSWVREDKKTVLKETRCNNDTADVLLRTEQVYMLPPMQTTPGSPIAIEGEDGQLEILGKGYHDFNGGTVILNKVPIELPPLGTAVKDLLELFSEFDFQTPSDKSRAIANLISPALSRGQFVGGWVPIALAEADLSQAGKGLQHRMMVAIYLENPYVITVRQGGVGSLDESLSTALISGKPFIRFDNVRDELKSQLLESLITDGQGQARVPYREEVTVYSKGLYFMLTSNGFQATPDFGNRSCIVRIRKRIGNTYKKFPDKNPVGKPEVHDLEKHVERNRAYYLGCIYAVLKEWVSRGKPGNEKEVRHDCRDWVQKTDWIVQELFKLPAIMDGHVEAVKRISNPSLNFVRALCLAAEADGRMDETWKASDFVNLASNHSITIPGHKVEYEEDAKRQIGIQMGLAFGKANLIEVEGFSVIRTIEQERRDDGRGNRDIKSYRISKAAAKANEQVAELF